MRVAETGAEATNAALVEWQPIAAIPATNSTGQRIAVLMRNESRSQLYSESAL
jgi:hypothetical protein